MGAMSAIGDSSDSELASVDGRISAADEAVLPLPDPGLFRGDGVFEVMRLYAGVPFARREHFERMLRSGALIDLEVDRVALERDADALIERIGERDCLLRVVFTRAGRRVMVSEPMPNHSEPWRLASVLYAPNVILDGVKSISYAANMHATRLAAARGGDEALLVRADGTVLEAPTSTIFWAGADGALRTPALDCGILDSITRRHLVAELEVEQGSYSLAELRREAREVFLASTTREVQAVVAIDEADFEAAGPATRDAHAAFRTGV
ncbi:MAG: aminotransferase class IV, partial [Solirubrobacterales bacterium]|nr:aminotransferase class IV [Solirubrobacterales bacterium]